MEDQAAYNRMLSLTATVEANRQRDNLAAWMNSPHGEIFRGNMITFLEVYRDNH